MLARDYQRHGKLFLSNGFENYKCKQMKIDRVSQKIPPLEITLLLSNVLTKTTAQINDCLFIVCLNSPFFVIFSVSEVGGAVMGNTAEHTAVWAQRLKSISCRIFQQTIHFNMYTTTS